MTMKRMPTVVAHLCAGAAMIITATQARANLMITPIFSSDYSDAAKAQVNDAIAFYTSNITGNTSVVIGFGLQTDGGASARTSFYTRTYSDYTARLRGNATESATDVSALKTLTPTAPVGNGNLVVTTTLAVQLGLATQNNAAPKVFADPTTGSTTSNCGTQVVNACVAYNASYNMAGTPTAGFFGVTQHEINEVLGSSSWLSGVGAPAGANGVNTTSVATPTDLFRYSAPNARSFSTNPGPAGCQTSSPTAYLSVDGGTTNLAPYNNCNNGGDYGDFAVRPAKDPQVYTGDENGASALNLNSPEVTLLDAIGYNFGSFATVASGTPVTDTGPVGVTTTASYGGADDGIFAEPVTDVPEPTSLALLAVGLASTLLARRRHMI